MKNTYPLLSLLMALPFATSAYAEAIYVAQSPLGAGSGGSSGDARGVSYFNTSANWSSQKVAGKIGPGDTVHLVGVITSALTVQDSGTAGSPITILFDSGAKLTNPAWPSSGALIVAFKNYITIDGGNTGVIESTNNGTNFANHLDSVGIKGNGSNFLVVKNLTVQNLYVRAAGGDGQGFGAWCITNQSGGSGGMTGFSVTNCTLHDAATGIISDYGPGCSNYDFSYNTIYNVNHGGVCADRDSSSSMTGLSIHHNHFFAWSNWNDTANNRFHHNGFYGWADSGGSLSNVAVYCNVFGPGYGNQYQTSGVYFSGGINNISIYNNLFTCAMGESASPGLIYLLPSTASTLNISNNTMITGGSGAAIDIAASGSAPLTLNIKNNIGVGNGGGSFIVVYNNSNVALNSDYNLAYNFSPAGDTYIWSPTNSATFFTPASWKSLGFDVHGSVANPLLDTNFRPMVGSPAIDGGTVLAGAFASDKDGAARPSGATWDIGAFEFQGLSTVVAPTAATVSIDVR